jgi:hypothetical protein
MKTTLNSLIDDITTWHYRRNLIKGSSDKDQFHKLIQECAELSDNMCKGKDIRDDIGDILVVLINIAERNGLTLQECAQVAYDDIKHRKGRMISGVFVKEQDWPTESRIDAIGQNGGDGEHYHKVTYAGLYD